MDHDVEEREASVRRHPSARHKTEEQLHAVLWQQLALVQDDGQRPAGFVDMAPGFLPKPVSARRVRNIRDALREGRTQELQLV